MRKIKRLFELCFNFIFKNHEKLMTIQAVIVSAYYFKCIYKIPAKKLEERFGTRGVESPEKEDLENLKLAMHVGDRVARVTTKAPWETKCLCRAWTAQYLLKKRHVHSTMYLGIGKDETGKMVAHAWLRCGQVFVTGGDGSDYTTVAKFYVQK